MPTNYNPYTPQAVSEWHQELSKHVGWHVRHVVDYFLDRGFTEIKMIDVGCCTGRLVELMNERITISDAILIDAISELTDHAKSIFGDKYKYETTVLGNKIGVTDVTLPQSTNGAVNLGGATARKQTNDVRPNVPINTFDALWKEKYMGFEPNLIKIDAEGLDIDVIEGMREFLTSLDTKPLIVYEIAGINMSEDEVDEVYDRLSFLTEMGYEPIWEDSLAPKKCCDLVIGIKDEIETII